MGIIRKTATYNLQLVGLSLIVAIFASYTALELAGRVSQSQGRNPWFWLVGGAISMGTGIFSMHFIGMLAFHLPIAHGRYKGEIVRDDRFLYKSGKGSVVRGTPGTPGQPGTPGRPGSRGSTSHPKKRLPIS